MLGEAAGDEDLVAEKRVRCGVFEHETTRNVRAGIDHEVGHGWGFWQNRGELWELLWSEEGGSSRLLRLQQIFRKKESLFTFRENGPRIRLKASPALFMAIRPAMVAINQKGQLFPNRFGKKNVMQAISFEQVVMASERVGLGPFIFTRPKTEVTKEARGEGGQEWYHSNSN